MTIRTARPYAAKAIVEHHFDVDHLDIYVTFRFAMDTTVKPEHTFWVCEVDEAAKAVTASVWQDSYTLLLTIANIVVLPEVVTLEYEGPDATLRITWQKQWEPWGPIVSIEIPPVSTTRTFSAGPAAQDDVDVSNVNVLFLDASANDITIGGFVGGVNGQVLHITKLDESANNVTLEDHEGGGNQDIHLHARGDETLVNEHGGWVLACNGTDWYDTSHAKHV